MKSHIRIYGAVIFLLVACNKSELSPSNIFPLFNTTITARNIFPDTLSYIDTTNIIHLIYRDTILKVTFDTLLNVPDTSWGFTYFHPGNSVTLPPGTVIWGDTFDFFSRNNYFRFKEVWLEDGDMVMSLVHSIKSPLLLRVRAPMAFAPSGNSFDFSDSAGYNPAPNSSYSYVRDTSIAEYRIKTTGLKNNTYNKIEILVEIATHPSAPPATINTGDFLTFVISIKNFKIKKGVGIALTSPVNVDVTSEDLGKYSPVSGEKFLTSSIKAMFRFYNYMGVSLEASMDTILAINRSTGKRIVLQAPSLTYPVLLNTAIYGEPPLPSSQLLDMSAPPSNLNQVIGIVPDAVRTKGVLTINPAGSISGGNDFIIRGYGINIYLDVDLPLKLSMKNLTIKDTIRINPPIKAYEPRDKWIGKLILRIVNSFPFSITPSFVFMDEYGRETLLLNDTTKIITTGGESTLEYMLVPEMLSLLAASRKVLLKARFTTYPENVEVSITPEQKMEVRGLLLIKVSREV